MTTNDRSDDVADLSAREFNRGIADPDVFCGGGSVAALACAGAAASALLVFRLSHRRKSNATRRDDIASLQKLLAAQRSAKATGDWTTYYSALERAALAPIHIAEQVGKLLSIITPHLPIATRFTVSDLGAAATIAEGAARGALLTAEVNIVLLAENPESAERSEQLRQQWDDIHARVVAHAAEIEQATREAVIGGQRKGGVS